MNEKKYKHLTQQDRLEIQECLNKGMSFKDIGKRIEKDQTTVSKEVKKHIKTFTNSYTTTDETCPKHLKAPFVCNGCNRRSSSSCHYPKRLYHAKEAQTEYRELLTEAREGIPLNKESFYETEAAISAAVRKGQHIYHIIQSNNFPTSKTSIYRHINKGYYSISNIDLPRAVKFKPRRAKQSEFVPKWAKEGRTYADFLQFLEQNDSPEYAEMDSLIGRPGGKIIVTLHFNAFDFMVGLLCDNKTAAATAAKINELKDRLTLCGFSFGDLFPILLTDNGGEFSCVNEIECDQNDLRKTKVFFCEPNAPYEKPHIEKNHTLFRDIVPTGTSFDDFSQQTVDLIFSHVNAVKRKQFNGKSPYDLFTFSYSSELASALGISFVDPKNVIQSPALLN